MSLHSTLRSAHVLAKDGLDLGGALAGWGAGLLVGWTLDLIPAQALRVCAGRDYDRAVRRAAALADAEADVDSWEPGEASYLSWGVDGATTIPDDGVPPVEHAFLPCGVLAPDCDSLLPYKCSLEDGHGGNHVAWAGKLPISEWTDGSHFVFEPIVLSAASADDVPPSSAADDGPSEVCGVPLPSEGHPLADLIAEVLADHQLNCARGDWAYGCDCGEGFNSLADHEMHVAAFVAERIEKAAQPAQLLRDASAWLIQLQCDGPLTDDQFKRELNPLIGRLHEAINRLNYTP